MDWPSKPPHPADKKIEKEKMTLTNTLDAPPVAPESSFRETPRDELLKDLATTHEELRQTTAKLLKIQGSLRDMMWRMSTSFLPWALKSRVTEEIAKIIHDF